ncbi:Git1 protein [Saccharomycopsis crataegensis]|uniref:Git1 protein n=1 Tax=Saccharomycopsis crataegensis TaxID=43959 RepID=A0AAV5QRB6_9ASCO|nr:Git1 protein [Saccharomycopsis crataegensis]
MSLPEKNQDYTKEIADEHIEAINSDPQELVYDPEARKDRSKTRTTSDIITIVASGFALISDGYQNNVMSMLNKVYAVQYPHYYKSDVSTRVSNASLVGTILGQVGMGFCCDYMGRKWAIVTATLLLVIGTILCAASHGVTVEGMFWMLTVFRGMTGLGIGSEYSASTVSANEAANESVKRRGGVLVLVTNLPLSLGGPFALIIFLIVYSICGSQHLDALWRTLFAIGAFWPLSVFYFRYKMATSTLYKKNAIKKRVPYWLVIKYCWKRLLGVCLCWFLYDFVTFPNGIFSGSIISSVLKDSKDLKKIAEWNLLLGIIAIPGVIVGAYLIDVIGRKYTLMLGFMGYLIFGLIIGCAYEKISKIVPLFIVFYGLMNSLSNMGPGDNLGVVASESFPTAVRGTCYGFAAAIGKVGAVVGTQTFQPIRDKLGARWTFIIAALCGVSGVIVAALFVPHLKEDDLLENDIKFNNYLIEQGWHGHLGSDESESTVNEDELSK